MLRKIQNAVARPKEKTWKHSSVKRFGEKYILLVRPGYGTWCSDPDDVTLSLQVVEAKRADSFSDVLP
ncbi:uncharacterized protein N7529_007831 [Penicillium soppii]|uniref:uncharacterized protein n=1 Tax=Penicillium soppii TaxID=69789 RepID=UPI002547C507|nr:uncharacterized protein N7529_007831 [Penicillium soppii]KAJ5860521.1 hypothetical protein N7529_007831 [Penicillium soppii]